jgi:formylglycine-generating enzyme required for sulfatase activity
MRASTLGLAAALALAQNGCSTDLAPHGEALFVVDTDMPVPQLAGRLRVDLYAEDGTWFESRDIGRSDPLDWPASFGVYSDDDVNPKRVLVRLRAYPEGAVRDYRGEHFKPRPVFSEPFVASSIDDLCANAPTLALGGHVTMRRGPTPLTDFQAQDRCVPPNVVGSAAAKVVIEQTGLYQFDVSQMSPYYSASTIFLRSTCDDPSSQIACDAEPNVNVQSSAHFPRLQAQLDPGTYWVITGGQAADFPSDANFPADVTLEAIPLDGSFTGDTPTPPPTPPDTPRLLRSNGAGSVVDETPPSEPAPTATVDRLVLVNLVPGVVGSVRVTLRGECAGTMARMGAADGAVDPTTAETCVDTENVRVPVTDAALDPDLSLPTASAQGSFGVDEPCPAPTSGGSSVCVPGGVFLLGTHRAVLLGGDIATGPERITKMTRFWMDEHEVTVGDLRSAVAGGLAIDPDGLVINDGPLGLDGPPANPDEAARLCTYSSTPMGRDDFPVSCVSWRIARAYCQMRGGDLPTEAQWEYAATAAGKAYKSLFPWGDDTATCAGVVFGRGAPWQGGADTSCSATGFADDPQPVMSGTADVTPLGIHDLQGSMVEWTKDSPAAYDSDCWLAQPLTSPSCWEDDAPFHIVRGQGWPDPLVNLTIRIPQPGDFAAWYPILEDGFRCTYEQAP